MIINHCAASHLSRPDRGPNRRIIVENQSSPQRCRSLHIPLVTPTTKTAEYQYSSGGPGSNQVTLTHPKGQVRGLGRKLRVGIGTSPHRRRSVDDGNTANPRNPSAQTALSQSSVASVAARIAGISQIADRIGECGLKTDSVRAGIGLGLSVDHGITVRPRDFNDSWMPWGPGRRRDGKASGRACGLNQRTRIGIGTGSHRRRPVSDDRLRRHRKPATWSQNLIHATIDSTSDLLWAMQMPYTQLPRFSASSSPARVHVHAIPSTVPTTVVVVVCPKKYRMQNPISRVSATISRDLGLFCARPMPLPSGSRGR